jgi:tRNA A-37 threonylcarbamoyl transferase component Bud32
VQKKYDKARIYLEKGLLLAKETNMKEAIRDAYRILSELHAAKGNYKQAFRHHKLFFEMYKKLFNENRSNQIAEMQTRYETLKKEKEIEILTKNTVILEKDNKISKLTRNVFIMGFVLVTIVLALLLKKYLYLFSFWKKQKYAGRFRLVEEIGSGGMGTVYKAHTIRNKSETAAVKVLKQDLFKDESYRKRFKQEATIIDKLEHPNIVKIIERGESEDKLYIAMELLQGKTLSVKIDEEGKMELNTCFHIMEQIADALVLIHGKDIVHRDLKPSNIMLIERDGDPNYVKLLDFGLAKMKFQTSLTSSGILVGTLNFVAPEQLTDSQYSPAGDVYSLGVTFYEMVTGKIVFPGDTATDIMKQVLDKSPVEPNRFRPDIPPLLNDLIMKMMSKKKDLRPPVQDVLETVKRIKADWTTP